MGLILMLQKNQNCEKKKFYNESNVCCDLHVIAAIKLI